MIACWALMHTTELCVAQTHREAAESATENSHCHAKPVQTLNLEFQVDTTKPYSCKAQSLNTDPEALNPKKP